MLPQADHDRFSQPSVDRLARDAGQDMPRLFQVRDGQWYTGAGHSRPQTCVDYIIARVDY